MIRKIIGITIVGLLLLIGLTGVSVVSTGLENSHMEDSQSSATSINIDEYYDVNVFVFGRCRTIVSRSEDPEGPFWNGGLYIGYQYGVEVGSTGIYDEWVFYLIRNDSTNVKGLKIRGTLNVAGTNASGLFYWGAKGTGASLIAPRIFCIYHAEKVSIIQDWEE